MCNYKRIRMNALQLVGKGLLNDGNKTRFNTDNIVDWGVCVVSMDLATSIKLVNLLISDLNCEIVENVVRYISAISTIPKTRILWRFSQVFREILHFKPKYRGTQPLSAELKIAFKVKFNSPGQSGRLHLLKTTASDIFKETKLGALASEASQQRLTAN